MKSGLQFRKGDFTLTFDRLIKSGSGYLLGVILEPEAITEEAAVVLADGAKVKFKDFHDMLGHPGLERVRLTAKDMGIELTGTPGEKCKHCALAKILVQVNPMATHDHCRADND